MKYIMLCLVSILLLGACKKSEVPTVAFADIRIVNAVYGAPILKLNSGTRDSVMGYNGNLFTLFAGNNNLVVYPVKDSSHPYYTSMKTFSAGTVFSLFLTGLPTQVDSFFVQDNIPPYYQDSTVGVRCVNLSTAKSIYHVTLASDSTTSVFSGLGYKTISAFRKFPLLSTIPAGSVTFQVRDVNGKMVTSYTLPASANSTYTQISIANSRNRNITLVIRGSIDSSSSSVNKLALFPVRNY